MTALDLARFSALSLRGHRLRSALSLLGVAIGIASVMVLTSLGEGARRYIASEFEALGSNLVIVVPGKTETEGEAPLVSEAPHDLTIEDMEAIVRYVPRIARAAPISFGQADASWGGVRREVTIAGTTADFQTIRGVPVAIGRYLPEGESDRGARVCVIGAKVEHEVFGGRNPLGEILRLGSERFKVIGVMGPRGRSLGMDLDEMVHVPVVAALALFDRRGLFRIMAQVRTKEEMHAAADQIRGVLKERHDGIDDVTLILQDSIIASLDRILKALTLALVAIAAISLAVAGIGIMNVMLVSVSERTGEIGLLRALGAESRQVLEIFLAEASLLSLAGGAVGIAGGYALAAFVRSTWPAFPARPPGWAVAAAVAVALAVGLGFGAVPARRAARLDPNEALGRRGR